MRLVNNTTILKSISLSQNRIKMLLIFYLIACSCGILGANSPFLKSTLGSWWFGKQTGSHKNCLPCTKWLKTNQMYLVPLSGVYFLGQNFKMCGLYVRKKLQYVWYFVIQSFVDFDLISSLMKYFTFGQVSRMYIVPQITLSIGTDRPEQTV